MRPKIPIVLAAILTPACGEPTRPNPGNASSFPTSPTALDLLRPVVEDEMARLLPYFGSGDSEQPLRHAFRILADRTASDRIVDIAAVVRDAGGLVESYRHARDASVDPSDLDAIQLLIAAVDETSRRTQ